MTKKSYTKEFQENAVRLATFGEKSVAAVARELGVPEWKLRGWIKKQESKAQSNSNMDELVRLHNENRRLKEENEILKKAAAYFAKN
ncbi:MAG: transposase, partial [Cyanobacteria bacterium]|nr:transposase [Cyanobacteriota bacterium]